MQDSSCDICEFGKCYFTCFCENETKIKQFGTITGIPKECKFFKPKEELREKNDTNKE